MQKASFKRSPLAQAIAVALGSAVLLPVHAQDAEGERAQPGPRSAVIEEVVVVGYRSSLVQAMDRKRAAVGVMDAITAEDIGKFPDQNLAEALQRIPGVSIDRSNSEGARITVRGMGPEFNLVTLNGRSMPTEGGRSFDFNDIATEAIRAVEVFKTPQGRLPSGGIGATVNMITARPFDDPGFRSALSAKLVHESSASDGDLGGLDEFTPELAGLFSNTFADDTFGVLLSGSYQKRDNREEFAEVANWIPNYEGGLNGGTIDDTNQRADGTTFHPQNAGYGFADNTRERINGQLVVQWAPSERLRATLDYTYSEVDFEQDQNSFGIWFNNPNVAATVNERGTVTQVTQTDGDFAVNVARTHTIKENDSFGINLDWQVTDALSLSLDAHDSSSTLKGGGLGDGVPGSSANLIVGNTHCDWCGFVPGAGPFTAAIDEKSASFGANGIPRWNATFVDTETGEPLPALRRSDIGSLFGQAFDVDNKNDITQLQLAGTWLNESGGAIKSIEFGYARTEQEFVNRNAFSGLLPAGFWLTSAQYWPDDGWQEASFAGLLGDFSNGGSFPLSNYFVTDFGTIVDTFETIDASADPVGTGVYWPGWGPDFQDPSGNRGFFWPGPLGNASGSGIEENIDAAYLQVNISDQFNGLPFNARAGVRYERAETKSTGDEVPALAVVWVGGDEFVTEFGPEPVFVGSKSTNNVWLPVLDLDMEVVDDVVVRFSYNRSLARPPIGALSPVRSFVGNPNLNQRVVGSGNPGLLPYQSDNFDLSLEWYYAPGSYVAITHFRKIVDNFLVSTVNQESFPGLLDPFRGAQAELAREQLVGEGAPVTNANIFQRINENLGVPVTTAVRAEPGDPTIVWDVTTTENQETGKLHGWELQIQHLFGDTGFGVQGNFTKVSGDVDADRDVIGRQFALPGLSDSANLIVFYENDRFSARLAYNWRDEFLSGFDQFSAPVFTEEYEQIDANFTWFASDNLAVFVEALNITEETQRVYVRYPEQFIRGNQYGARYNVGARYSFR
ncbi:MAG: TonB-dependent receptor [Pseudomonadales bacterium]